MKYIFYFLVILSCTISFAQSKNYETGWHQYNLKGQVQELRTVYAYQNNTLENKAKFYKMKAINDGVCNRGGAVIKFDTIGLIISGMTIRLKENYITVYTIDSINEKIIDSIALTKTTVYKHFPKDIKYKNNLNYKIPYKIPYQVYHPYFLKLNTYNYHAIYLTKKEYHQSMPNSFSDYRYTFTEDDKIKCYKEFLPSVKDTVNEKNEKPVKRVVYSYNDKGQVTATQHFFWEDIDTWGVFRVLIDSRFYVSSSDQVKHTYQYDKQGRIISMTLLVNNQKFWEEIYTYREDGDGLAKKEVYIWPGAPIQRNFVSPYTVFIYNEYGDVVEAKDMDAGKKVTDVRTYTYEYDKYRNWTMYWMYANEEEVPYVKGERLIKYFND
ncbi:hypothetical protein [Mesonia mobilis]|uniref:YD repeat-containing protein n=1 Tax=Mesonia mobilis TaxID=369791 RepID=A0ABQ3C923_9FLAO|nr:hypothetical protein [Mesonia mobilis]MBQ0739513.1 hypothetical protein [Aquimarina celericrescens]GGZ66067.1 hypothetical protein GCM10008088_28850 [Mesonia mobilis]